MDFGGLAAGLRAWAANGTAGTKAGVELLIWHEGWLRRGSFVSECIDYPENVARIRWERARKFSDRVTAGGLDAPRASTSEAAILDLAVALGEDRFRLASLGRAHRVAVISSFSMAAGIDEIARPPAAEGGTSR
jgi:hypothetical protein